MDLSVLATVFSLLISPACKEPGLRMQEEKFSKLGFASTMKLFCEHCEFATSFYTSRQTGHSFEVNEGLILAARNIGVDTHLMHCALIHQFFLQRYQCFAIILQISEFRMRLCILCVIVCKLNDAVYASAKLSHNWQTPLISASSKILVV